MHTVVIDEEEEEEEEVDEALADACDDVTIIVGRTVLLCNTVSALTGHNGLGPGQFNMSWDHGTGRMDRVDQEGYSGGHTCQLEGEEEGLTELDGIFVAEPPAGAVPVGLKLPTSMYPNSPSPPQ